MQPYTPQGMARVLGQSGPLRIYGQAKDMYQRQSQTSIWVLRKPMVFTLCSASSTSTPAFILSQPIGPAPSMFFATTLALSRVSTSTTNTSTQERQFEMTIPSLWHFATTQGPTTVQFHLPPCQGPPEHQQATGPPPYYPRKTQH